MTDELADITFYPGETKKWFVFRGRRWELTKDKDGHWKDYLGTVYALVDRDMEVDTETQAGIGIFHLPNHWKIARVLNQAAKPHDYKYASPEYQAAHPRSEGDSDLKRDVFLLSKEEFPTIEALLLSSTVHEIVREVGSNWWENKATDDVVKVNDGIDDV
jgi:hypothetical protein